uniref:GINS subunit domain-containing protein n=1 Tax=Alexandrium catenella TaxID=2925 RepID=A0A7S1ML27_ALECA|mmetsp:Transcript_28690/g.77786  ORF Transcript_28690/g.77786 Transcript_28690/m.77786 type:complete len:212 (+) Transcript_28690:99-734(+)|eukprot:CAMPEP_0171191954 /NCGR_PEP_ID=MMETSP0790-20130122/19625_1 /TAXON_ID=2925 /ORGANISM="Alexandrium catenella, Strain OF101" /LENGTH=211 /DNA_ID=CAMNT_0011657107 /DNA_START=99 /DNA_END=734 /DNA_ORIENTATION=+
MVLHMKKSVQLLKDLKRSRWLPQFNDKMVKEVIEEILNDTREMKSLISQNTDLDGVSREVAAGLCLYNDLVDRNRRCLLAYLNFRLERIEELRWEVGLMVPEEKFQKLHESEKQYFHRYNEILDKYMKTYMPKCKEPLNLTADAEAPEDMNVQIRVCADGLGEIVTPDSGVVRLRKGYQLFVKRTDIEHLIRAGKVEHIKTVRMDDGLAGL